MLSFSALITIMTNLKPVEQADDRQLRFLTRDFDWHPSYCIMIRSQLPLLSVERAQLINLLMSNDIHSFLH